MIKLLKLFLITLCTFFLSTILFAKNNQQTLDSIAATVNDVVIMQSEITATTNAIKEQIRSSGAPMPEASVLHKKILEQIIDRKLQLQIAEQAGIKISDNQVDDAISSVAKANNISVTELYQKVGMQNLDRAQYRKEIREELMLQQIEQQQVGSKISMTPEDVKNFMRTKGWKTTEAAPSIKEYNVEDLIVFVPDNASAEQIAAAKTQADALATKAKQGASYISLVTENNKNTTNDNLGWRKLTELPSMFMEPIAQAKKGNVIGPIQAGNGFHILHLADIRTEKMAEKAEPMPTEEQARQMLYQKKFSEALKKWTTRLRGQAVVNLHPGQDA